jgi:hypothetical protein
MPGTADKGIIGLCHENPGCHARWTENRECDLKCGDQPLPESRDGDVREPPKTLPLTLSVEAKIAPKDSSPPSHST